MNEFNIGDKVWHIENQKVGDAAFKLNILLAEEHLDLVNLQSIVSNKKLKILNEQEKRNVAAAEMEIQASDNYRVMRLQEHRVARIEEFIKLAKKNMSSY